jgi:hypothetical protein
MNPTDILLLSLLILLAAALYSSVGHGGASGYLAAMALFGLAPAVMRPTALCLNLIVSSLATFRFRRAGHFRWRTFWPFAVTSVPFAFLGGALTLPATIYKRAVGLVLLFAAVRLFLGTLERAAADESNESNESNETRDAPRLPSILLGACIGLLSGLTGVGGGIFLSPLLLLAGWADTRRAAAVSAAFILVNSAAGLLGNPAGLRSVSAALPYFALAALAGGVAGTEFGSRRLPPRWITRTLAAVLVVAGLKLIFV